MKRIRLTSGLGFYGDNWTPVLSAIERGEVDYVCSDHLAELTLAILQKDRLKDPAAGYARDLLPMLARLWPAASERGVKFVLNAGGLNPHGAAQALRELFAVKSWQARIAVVSGDDVMLQIDELQASGEQLNHMDTGAPITTIRDQLIFANLYLGAQPIAQALERGAEIVITGRVADAALFLGPLLYEFQWDTAEWDRLAQGVVAGHLLECSGQGAGGNFGAAGVWQRIPDLTHIGFPIADVAEDGEMIICKAPGSGGRINFHTVRQQLLPELGPLYAGYVAWRVLLPEQAIPEAIHRELFEFMTFCLPPGEQFLGYPVAGPDNDLRPGHRRLNVIWYRPAEESTELRRLLTDETGAYHPISIPPPLIRREAIAEMLGAAEQIGRAHV